ncbi:hypothetical protein GCM10023189_07710 [Nibrella saemangeumensis]|uniref:Type 1 periplasmic binding fold superfamily protein n=2 Tax=Nibrella saemangeumensis TaxID=1084526 RepID=A0ABP8MH36_9BACT
MGLLLAGGLGLFITGCDRANEPEPADENELITTVSLKFTQQGSATTQTFTFRDTDGDGGQVPSRFDNISLKANTTYTLTIDLLDESKSPATNLTSEIQEKKDEHLLVYTANPASLLTYTYGDVDGRNFPIGLAGTARTGAAGTGKLTVRLRHQPPVNGVAVKNGTVAPGSDDINIDFNLTVQ